jgi:heme oxygenase
MKARGVLRAGTAAEHERVDRLFSALDLALADDYRRFLLAQAAAFLPVEAALDAAGAELLVPDWTARRRGDLLRQDIAALAASLPPAEPVPVLLATPQILGALYVLEGSRLGGARLKRGVPAGMPMAFLAAPQQPGAWRKLLETLDHHLYETASIQSAIEAARGVFRCFEAGGRRFLES